MIYEITLTEQCTRQCNFCTLKQTNYIETIDNINKYYDYIIKYQQLHGNQYFYVSLFGGEPLLNIKGIEKCVELFKNHNCEIDLYTNADLIESIYNKDFTKYLTIQISAYEIFQNINKYKSIISQLKCKNIQFAYTFSDKDLNKINEFITICKSLNVNYKFSLSHTNSSWNTISSNNLYNSVFNWYVAFTNDYYCNNFSLILPMAIKKEFTQATDLMFNYKTNIKTCISQNKLVFAHGLNIGHCSKLFCKEIRDEIPFNCEKCQYKNVCSKSCLDEHINHNVPEKLCTIEKAKIEAMLYIINKYCNEYKMKKLIQYHVDKMNGVI